MEKKIEYKHLKQAKVETQPTFSVDSIVEFSVFFFKLEKNTTFSTQCLNKAIQLIYSGSTMTFLLSRIMSQSHIPFLFLITIY